MIEMKQTRPSVQVAVTMRKERLTGAAARWLDWRWKLHDVAIDEGGFGSEPRLMHQSEDGAHWLFPAMKVELFTDDAEGVLLQLHHRSPGLVCVVANARGAGFCGRVDRRTAGYLTKLSRRWALAGCARNSRAAALPWRDCATAGKEVKPATDTPACSDPGAFVFPPPAAPLAAAAPAPAAATTAAAAPAKSSASPAAPVKK